MKSLKKFFISIFILIFSSVCLVNVTISASSWRDPGDCVRELSHLDLQPQTEIPTILPLNLENLCFIIAEKTGEAIPSEIEDQQLMVCKSLYLLFKSRASYGMYNYNLDVVLNILFQNEQIIYLCSGDQNLDCKIKSILTKESSKTLFYNYYVMFMNSLKRNCKAYDEITRADALLLLSYMYLYGTKQLPEEMPIFNAYEELNLIIQLKTIFEGTIYESILGTFLSI